MSRPNVTIVLAGEADVRALRRIVNQAYRELAEMGLNYTGTYQDDSLTHARGRQGRLPGLHKRVLGRDRLA
jgi:hypothetical protein